MSNGNVTSTDETDEISFADYLQFMKYRQEMASNVSSQGSVIPNSTSTTGVTVMQSNDAQNQSSSPLSSSSALKLTIKSNTNKIQASPQPLHTIAEDKRRSDIIDEILQTALKIRGSGRGRPSALMKQIEHIKALKDAAKFNIWSKDADKLIECNKVYVDRMTKKVVDEEKEDTTKKRTHEEDDAEYLPTTYSTGKTVSTIESSTKRPAYKDDTDDLDIYTPTKISSSMCTNESADFLKERVKRSFATLRKNFQNRIEMLYYDLMRELDLEQVRLMFDIDNKNDL